MQEQIQRQIAALNAVIQRSARTTGERPDPAIADALTQEYADAWEGLEGCGITEEMLASDPETLTFWLEATDEQAEHLLTTMPLPAVMNQVGDVGGPPDDPDMQELPRTEKFKAGGRWLEQGPASAPGLPSPLLAAHLPSRSC